MVADSGPTSGLHRTTLEGEQPLRALLNKDNDKNQNSNLSQDCALPGFEDLAGKTQTQCRVHRACELADPAEHHDHERIDDIRLSEVRTDIADLRQRAAGKTRDTGAHAECEHIYVRSRDADAAGHRAVLRHTAHEQPEARAREQ